MSIEVGMLVQIIPVAKYPGGEAVIEMYRGHIGQVLRLWDETKYGKRYEVEGARPDHWVWFEDELRPINPPDWEKLATPNEIPEVVHG